jgi:hypothetical protein
MRALGVVLGLALVGAASACELLVPSDLPAYTCNPSAPNGCLPGSYCDGKDCKPCDALHCSADGGATPDASDETTPPVDAPGDVPGQPETSLDDAADAPPPDVASDGNGCTPGALGCPCATSADCASHICGDATVLSASFTGGTVCTQTCCTSADCPGGFVCYGAGTGGSYCVRATTLARPVVSAGASPGASCSVATDCRSGVCNTGHCQDTCCSDAQCASPAVCSLTPGVDGHTSFVCAAHAGSADRTACSTGASCASGVCAFSTCRPHCCGRTSALAMSYHACALDAVSSDAYTFADYPSGDPTGGAFGAACTGDTQCVTRMCDLSTQTCSDVCCTDADCTGYGAFVCRPAQRGPGTLTTQHLLCTGGP